MKSLRKIAIPTLTFLLGALVPWYYLKDSKTDINSITVRNAGTELSLKTESDQLIENYGNSEEVSKLLKEYSLQIIDELRHPNLKEKFEILHLNRDAMYLYIRHSDSLEQQLYPSTPTLETRKESSSLKEI